MALTAIFVIGCSVIKSPIEEPKSKKANMSNDLFCLSNKGIVFEVNFINQYS